MTASEAACCDALGAPVDFMSLEQIRQPFGDEGIRDYASAYGRLGAITDDTQMMLFAAEGQPHPTMPVESEVTGRPRGWASLRSYYGHEYCVGPQGKTSRSASSTGKE